MDKRKSLKELEKAIIGDLKAQEQFIRDNKKNSNTQVVKMVIEAEARIKAFENVLNYIASGSTIMFDKVEEV